MRSRTPSRRRRVVLTLAAALAATTLPVLLPVAAAQAAPAKPAAVLLAAPTVTPSTVVAGSSVTVRGTKCVPGQQDTRVYVSLLASDGGFVTSNSTTPAADGTWTAHLTPSLSTPAGTYAVSATCDRYTSQASYRSRPVTITASTATPWTTRSPSLPNVRNGTLTDVDCTAAATKAGTPGIAGCVAVGYASVGGHAAPLIETWDGANWTVAPVTSPVAGDVFLSAVDCVSTARCVTVGDIGTDSGHEAFTAVLSGGTWTAQVLPAPAGQHEGSLDGVSCPTATVCVAVGSTGSLSEGSHYLPTAYRLQGATWTQIASPSPTSPTSSLVSVSCVNARTCVAVGSDQLTFPTRLVAQVFDGAVWHVMRLPDLRDNASPSLRDVTCATVSSCVAVGSRRGDEGNVQPLLEVLTNTTWRVATIVADPGVGGSLASVSCANRTECTAVGSTDPFGSAPDRPLAVTLRNGTWTANAVDVPDAASSNFDGVSCVGPCVAVGDAGNVPLAEFTSGSNWQGIDAPAADGYLGGGFAAVACSAANACTAGGFSYSADRSTTTPLVNRWDGTAWSQQALPSLGDARVTGVACPTVKVCFAVGGTEGATGSQPVLLQWRAGVWGRVRVVLPHHGTGSLTAVSCSSATACLAVGQSDTFDGAPFAVALTGSGWQLTPTPPVGGLQGGQLRGVSCVPGGCRVVGGGYDPDTFEAHGIDLLWDGAGFTVGPPLADSSAVSCTSVNACVAVGGYSPDGTAASVFDGSTWTREPLPDSSGGFAGVVGVACHGALACVAVGSGDGAFIARRATSGVWAAEPAPSGTGGLRGVACTSDTACVAVGGDTLPTIVVSPATG